jgi:hypothetical protein
MLPTVRDNSHLFKIRGKKKEINANYILTGFDHRNLFNCKSIRFLIVDMTVFPTLEFMAT